MIRIGIVAGEASGDNLGAELLEQIKSRHPDVTFTGVGGSRMRAAGCECLYSTDDLSVMGISEVLSSLPRLLNIRRELVSFFRRETPDVFIGIDAPDFNFPLEKKLRQSGIKTVHYVSPSVWAWREYRLKYIARAVDLMLVMFPFEEDYYERHGINARFVGHPMAHDDTVISMPEARTSLQLPQEKKVIALMPGSRQSELRQHAGIFMETALRCYRQNNSLLFVCNLVKDAHRQYVESLQQAVAPQIDVRYFTGQPSTTMAAANVVLLASGTAALEAMLLERPMVVAYRVNWLTYQLAKRMIKLPYVSLPNILAGRKIVPECLQSECNAGIMTGHIMHWLDDTAAVTALVDIFRDIHRQIRSPEVGHAARAILDLVHAS